MKTALIAGYTGLVGGHVLELLLADDRYKKVIAVGRRSIDLQHPKLIQQEVDFDNLKIEDSIDEVFCCLGTTIGKAGSKEKFKLIDFQYPINLAVAAKPCGADSFLLISAHGATKTSSVFYSQVKGEVEEAIGKIGFAKLEILRPSLLMGDRKESRAGEDIGKVFMKLFGFLFLGPLKNIRGIEASSVAKAMVYFANDGGGGKRIHYSSVLRHFK